MSDPLAHDETVEEAIQTILLNIHVTGVVGTMLSVGMRTRALREKW
jgi:hypothetical protein